MEIMRLKAVLLAFAAIFLTTPLQALSIHREPIGIEVVGSVPFARSEVALPPGKWRLIAAGEDFGVPSGGRPRSRLPFAHLVQIEKGRLIALVSLQGTRQYESGIYWVRDRNCARTDYLFAIADQDLNPHKQWCSHVTHLARNWMLSDLLDESTKALYSALVADDVVKPAMTLRAEAWIADDSEYIRVTYEISPGEYGGPTAPARSWSNSEWHVQNIGKYPAYREYADSWIEWAKPVLANVRAGFGRSLPGNTALKPIPVGTARAVAGAARGVVAAVAVPVGTKFVTVNGGNFTVQSADGSSVRTANTSNQLMTWQFGGLLPITSTTRVDPGVMGKLFPLKVGNKVVFDQTSVGNPNAWRHTVEVVGTEKITVDGKDYDTFVVNDLAEGLDPSQGGFARKRSVWYAPALGWLLRMREEQLGGAPERMNSWEIAKIVPPG
jgi:hypothetical protein